MLAVESADFEKQAAAGQQAGRRDGADFMGRAQQVAIAGVAVHAVAESGRRVEGGSEGEASMPHDATRRQHGRAHRADVRFGHAPEHFVQPRGLQRRHVLQHQHELARRDGGALVDETGEVERSTDA